MGTDDRSGAGASADASLRALSEFLTTNRAEILALWRAAVSRVQGEDAAADLIDPVPDLLDGIADLRLSDPTVTATEILEQGDRGSHDPEAAVTQLALLRDQVLARWESLPRGGAGALRLLNRAVDGAILAAVAGAGGRRKRLDRGLHRLAELQATPSSAGTERLLDGLLRIVLEESAAIDGAVLLRPEGPGLRVVAAAGVAAQVRGRTAAAGEGFGALVLQGGAPAQRRWAGDPLLPESGAATRLLLGMPLYGGGRVLGVLYVVSVTAHDFPADDLRLVRVAAGQAAGMVAAEPVAGGPPQVGDDVRAAHRRALATFAHDVRSPLGVVLMQAGVMHRSASREIAPERLASRAASVQRAALRIERLLADFVAFHDVRAGAVPLTVVATQPTDLVRHAVEEVRPTANERRVVLEAELSPGLPSLCADRERLQEALEHLLRAALHAVPDGGRVAVRAQHDEDGVVLSVHDSGPPIDPDEVGRAFDRAWKGERTGIGRSALGLALARGIVEAHGGRVWASSAAGEGNTFCMAIPAARA